MTHSIRLYTPSFLACLSLILMQSCSDGGGGGTVSGQIVDSLVEGLQYSTASTSGITDANGTFNYAPGENVTFMVGDIVIGTVTAAAVVSPVDLVVGAEYYDDDPLIINIARFLQTIDSDGLPGNGIQISQESRDAAIGESMNFKAVGWDTDPVVLATIAALTTNVLVDEEDAYSHGVAWLSGTYSGEYSGTLSIGGGVGTWNLSVNNQGDFVLIAADLSDSDQGDSGMIGPTGAFIIFLDNAFFGGQIIGTSIEGTWTGKDLLAGESGVFSGSLAVKAMAFIDMNDLPAYEALDGVLLAAEVYDAGGSQIYETFMGFSRDGDGLHAVSMPLDTIDEGIEIDTSLYVMSMSPTSIEFRGLSEAGEVFVGSLLPTGAASGTYYNLDGSPGGTFTTVASGGRTLK